MARDPVCGMPVIESTAKNRADYEGKTYFFCSQACKNEFEKDPSKYISGQNSKRPWYYFCCYTHLKMLYTRLKKSHNEP